MKLYYCAAQENVEYQAAGIPENDISVAAQYNRENPLSSESEHARFFSFIVSMNTDRDANIQELEEFLNNNKKYLENLIASHFKEASNCSSNTDNSSSLESKKPFILSL